MTILSVDDSRTIRSTVRNMVQVLGVECLEAEDGEKALEVVKDKNVDLILLDWEMPVMNGLDFLKTIKEDPKLQAIPVIMLTSVAQKERMIEAIRAGAKQYLTKPFTSEDLLTKLVQTLGIVNLEEI